MEIRVLSLFDGIACGYEALIRAGVEIEKYYASEIDHNAIKIAKKNHPDIIELGDINKIDFTQFIGKIDLIIGGSPCQDLSIAGNRKGLSGDRSGLFYKFIEALEVIKPKYFLLENNVGMPKEAYEEISRLMGCYPIEINSALVSAQTRKRYYWTNIGPQNFNLFGVPTVAIPQPKDKKIVLKDILESGIAPQNKSFCLTETYYKGTFSDMIKKHTRTMIAEPFIISLPHGYNNGAIKEQKAPTITSSKYEYNNLIAEPLRLGHIGATAAQANRVYSVNAKSVCLNANGGGGGAKTGLYKIDLPDGKYFIRKLTPIECERLQTLPDNYTEGISNSNRYKVLGNGWTVDVIAHIFSYLKAEPTWNYDNIKKTI